MAREIEFCLLGPLVLRKDGREAALPAAKLRTVLAALTLRAGRAVTLDELTEVVWGSRPPASARVTLQNYVRRLRVTLGDTARTRIVTQPGGYELILDDAELDITRFQNLLQDARRSARRGAWEDAAAQLRGALSLRRGEPLSDVLSELLLLREKPRLDEMCLQAIEERIDADLHLGRHADVVVELHELTTLHGLRERLHAMLMLALYRNSRQGDALAAYQRARQVLVDELGVEPGPDLRDLHRRILQADPALMPAWRWSADLRATIAAPGLPAGQPPVPGPGDVGRRPGEPGLAQVVPHQLPAPVRHFAGRHDQLKEMSRLLDEAAGESGTVVISAIGGTAGVGKTALGLRFAHQAVGRFPDGQLYLNLRGFDSSGVPVAPAEALRRFLDALQVPPGQVPVGIDAQAGLYRSLLAGKRMLIMLDNARDTEQVRPLFPGSPGCLVVITSRGRLSGLAALESANVITLGALTDAEAHELLARRFGAGRVGAEPEAAAELARLCARLPLALAIIAARAAAHPQVSLASLAADLREGQSALDALDAGEPAADTRTVFSWSYRHLAEPAAQMFRLLSSHPGPDVSVAAAASLAAVPRRLARQALSELAAAGLLDEPAPGRYAFHDLLRAYAAEQADACENEAQRRAAVRRVLDHYLHTARTAMALLEAAPEPLSVAAPEAGVQPEHADGHGQAMRWYAAEHRVLLALTAQALRLGFDQHACQLPASMAIYLWRSGHWHDWVATQRMALTAARRLGDHRALARASRGVGFALAHLGHHEEASTHLSLALQLYRDAGDRLGQAQIHFSFSVALSERQRHSAALEHMREALRIFRALGHRPGEAQALNALGWDHAQLGRHRLALGYCSNALQLCQEAGQRGTAAATWDSLGFAHHHLGHAAEAITSYRQAVAVSGEVGCRHGEAESLICLGEAFRAAGDARQARRSWEQALASLEELRHADTTAVRAKLRDLSVFP